MISGRSPFKGANQMQTFQNIKNVNYHFSDEANFTPEAKDLISRLLLKDPLKRLGAGNFGSENDYNELKNHPFFKSVAFDKVFLM